MTDALAPAPREVPNKPTIDGLEATWLARWDDEAIYRFERAGSRENVFSIDTPPPTVSGSLHIGHVFSYTHADVIARFQRMIGKDVFYPMGWDDNGLATERRVENYYGVRCDPSLPYDPTFEPPDMPGEQKVFVSRKNFVELCHFLTATDEEIFKNLWRHLGISIDWSLEYSTISKHTQAISQRGFLEMLGRDEVYSSEAPTLWDVDFRTAVSQAELEDRERPGNYHRLAFERADGAGAVEVETTRPEMLASCVALVAHPDDERFKPLFATTVFTPLFGVEVPIVAHELADPEKGTGIAMICTFGDTTDVTWWRELSLPTRALIGRDGRFLPAGFGDEGWPTRSASAAHDFYDHELEGKTVNQARAAIVDALRGSGALIGDLRPITHPRDRHLTPVVRQDPRAPRRVAGARRGAALAPGLHAPPLPLVGRGTQPGLEHLSSALLRSAVPDLVPDQRQRRDRLRPTDPRRRRVAARRPVERRAEGLRRRPAQPAPRLRRRP
jgi:valyl-tRNA synthetase